MDDFWIKGAALAIAWFLAFLLVDGGPTDPDHIFRIDPDRWIESDSGGFWKR